MKAYFNDLPIKIKTADCDDAYRCNYAKFTEFLESRMFTQTDLQQFCHTKIPQLPVTPNKNDADSIPWWLAFLLAIPLVLITMLIIKAIIDYRKKK